MLVVVLGLSTIVMADKLEVTTTSSPGSLYVDAIHYAASGNIASKHEFWASGGFTATVINKRNDGTTSAYDELFTGIQATSTPGSGATFQAIWFQDFSETTGWPSNPFTGEVGAYVFGTDGATMNVGSSTWHREISMDSYPAWSSVALMADGTSTDGYYKLSTYAQVLEGPDDLEALSGIYVSGTGGTAWQSFGYDMTASDGSASHSSGCNGKIPPLGSVWGTHVYVDAGSGTYIREVHGDDFVDWELGTFPGGGSFHVEGDFFGGMHATPWTNAN